MYVDLSDPLEYLDRAKEIGREAADGRGSGQMEAPGGGTLALCAAGAFPGLSNVLAMEAIARLKARGGDASTRVKDVSFSYFTAGLGGSGDVNLFITNGGPKI